MTPSSSPSPQSGWQSRSFSTSESGSKNLTRPPSNLVLVSLTTQIPTARSVCPAILSTLPTMLIHLIKTWLVDTESLQLIMTSHSMSKEVQSYYRLKLRACVAKSTVSPIASFQESINCLPSVLKIEEQGELIFQKCMRIKATIPSEIKYRRAVLQLLTSRLPDLIDPMHLSEISAGVALGLGGTLMTVANRRALFKSVMTTSKTSTNSQMGAMILGVCCAFGGPNMKHAQLKMVLREIVASYKTSTAGQMAMMITGISYALGTSKRSQVLLEIMLDEILVPNPTSLGGQMASMIKSVCHIFRGQEISHAQRDYVIDRIKASAETTSSRQTRDMIRGLCSGLGGPDMSWANLNAVLTLILDFQARWNLIEMGAGMAIVSEVLGGTEITAACRDTVVTKILSSAATGAADQMGAMICSVCHVLGGANSDRTNQITDANLAAVINQVLASHETCNALQIGSMIFYLCRALGGSNSTPEHRAVMVEAIKNSGRLHEISAAIRLVPGGPAVVDLLWLNIQVVASV